MSKKLIVGILSPGDMGHGIAKVLVHHGVDVVTCLQGRSERTKALAKQAGIRDELNAIAPHTVKIFANKLKSEAGIDLVDGCVIGGSPKVGDKKGATKIYVSGDRAKEVEVLNEYGLDVRYVGEEIGKASGLKMVYSALNKGLTALGTQAMVAAEAMGLKDEFVNELKDSQPQLLQKLSNGIPSMCPKAYRWHGEMREIAATYENLGMTRKVYDGISDVFKYVEATPVGKEIPEDRKIGTTLDSAVDILAKQLQKKN